MSIRYPGGLITKTPVTPSGPTGTNTAPGVWTIEQALEYQKAGNWPSSAGAIDSNFEYVTMLLPGNGTNGAQNNTFLDSSTNNFTITRNGNTTQGTFSPYGDNWSNYFDGTGDYLQTSSGTTLGTGDFTVEAWVFNTTSGQKPEIWINGGQVGQFVVSTNFNAADAGVILGALSPAGSGWSVALAGSTALTANTWNHIAWVRASGVITVYLNGVAGGTYSNSSNSISLGRIGAFDSSNYDLNGYISNLRVVAGTAVYTSAFTPPTSPLTAITNTSLLTCQSNRFRDASTNNFTITVNGNTSVQRFSPFSPTASYSAATIGGSGYFDGTGDYLETASTSAFNFGTGDFTIEFWLYPTAAQSSFAGVVVQGTDSDPSWFVQYDSGGSLLRLTTWSTNIVVSTNSPPLNTWTHFAFVRSGGGSNNTKLYVNGVLDVQATYTSTIGQTSTLVVGGGYAGGSRPKFTGYISNLRIVTGTAVYTAAFTPPTAPLTAITNTSLLLNMTNAGIIDNAMMNDLETVGNAQISTTQSKFGGSSMYFDGAGDWVKRDISPLFFFGTENFTVEAWVFFSALPSGSPAYSTLFAQGDGDTATDTRFFLTSTGLSIFTSNTSRASASFSWSTNTWYHVAFVRNAGNLLLFVNGTLLSTTAYATAFPNPTTYGPYIGADSYRNQGLYTLNGYIDDLRVTKGVARYTANFTPPTAAFPTR